MSAAAAEAVGGEGGRSPARFETETGNRECDFRAEKGRAIVRESLRGRGRCPLFRRGSPS